MQLFALPMLNADHVDMDSALADHSAYATLATRLAQAEQFVCGALQEGLWQVQAVGIVKARSQRDSVRGLAAHLRQRFSATNDSLQTLLKQFKSAFFLDNDHRVMLATLRNAPSRDFDLSYLGRTIQTHEVLLSLYTAASDNEQLSVPVQEFAATTLPMVTADLEDTMRLRALVARELATR